MHYSSTALSHAVFFHPRTPPSERRRFPDRFEFTSPPPSVKAKVGRWCWLGAALALAALVGSSEAYARRFRSPLAAKRQPVQSVSAVDRGNFAALACAGRYRMDTFATLDAVCDDCYELYKEPEIHSLCRQGTLTGPKCDGTLFYPPSTQV